MWFVLLGFVIDLLLLFLLRPDLWFVQRFLLLSGYVHFFFIDFSCYLFVGFLGSIGKFFGEGGKYINLRARIKILFVNIHTDIFFFKGIATLSAWVVPFLTESMLWQVLVFSFFLRAKAIFLLMHDTNYNSHSFKFPGIDLITIPYTFTSRMVRPLPSSCNGIYYMLYWLTTSTMLGAKSIN